MANACPYTYGTVRRGAPDHTFGHTESERKREMYMHVGGCQNYGPFLGPYYNTAPII